MSTCLDPCCYWVCKTEVVSLHLASDINHMATFWMRDKASIWDNKGWQWGVKTENYVNDLQLWLCACLHSYSWCVPLCDRQPSLCGVLLHRVLLCALHHHSAGLCANLCGPEEAQETCKHQTKASSSSGCWHRCSHFTEG